MRINGEVELVNALHALKTYSHQSYYFRQNLLLQQSWNLRWLNEWFEKRSALFKDQFGIFLESIKSSRT